MSRLQSHGGAQARPERLEVRPVPSRLPDSRRHSRDAGGRGENRRIGGLWKACSNGCRGRAGWGSPAAVAGGLRAHHTRARPSQTRRPDLRVAVVVEVRFRAVFEGNPDVDEILPPGLGALRRWRPRFVLQPARRHPQRLADGVRGARCRAGFGHFRYRFVYNVRIPRAQEILGVERTVHTAEHLASAVFYLGAPVAEIPRAQVVLPAKGRPAAKVTDARATRLPTPSCTRCRNGGQNLAPRRVPRRGATPERTGLEPVFIGAAGDGFAPFLAFRAVEGAPLSGISADSPEPLCSWATIAARRTWPPPSVCLRWSSSAPRIPPSGGRGAPVSEVVSRRRIAACVAQVIDALARLRVHA